MILVRDIDSIFVQSIINMDLYDSIKIDRVWILFWYIYFDIEWTQR